MEPWDNMSRRRVVFQAVDWCERDEYDEKGAAMLTVEVYGRCVDGAVVSAKLHGFKPSLLLKCSKRAATRAIEEAGISASEVGSCKLRDMNGYHPRPAAFAVVRFQSAQAFAAARRKLKDAAIDLYNCRLQPFMQLIHRANVSPSGWLSLPCSSFQQRVELESAWTELQAVPDPPAPMAPFVVTSYDIECYSASGDFPAAIKGYNKLGREIVQYADALRARGESYEDVSGQVEDAVMASLRGEAGVVHPCEVAPGQKVPSVESLRQNLLMDLADMMRHPGWAALAATERISRVSAKMNSLTARGFRAGIKAAAAAAAAAVSREYIACVQRGRGADHEVLRKGVLAAKSASPWAPATCVEDLAAAALRGAQAAHQASENATDAAEQIAAKAERFAAGHAPRCSPAWSRPPLPQLKGDPVIQVGLTTRVGRDDAMEKTALVLGSCDPVPGVRVLEFDDERDLLQAFAAEIRRADPDFVTGYNVMGFDFQYMRDRADELGIPDAQMEMGRSAPERSAMNPLFLEKRLVSSAYGDNTLRYYDMPGRVLFDLMKVVQREHKLSSYKLDAVAQHFTGDRKDDLSPADIFRMHAQGPAERAVVAKYCVQDCALCSDLAAKLNTLPNALGMSDVCLVPTSWIFLRGQGCKVLSLVAKRCRLDGFALPELRRSEAEGYDGAYVLTPKVGVYLDTPVAVLDFSSLYPSSMIATNLSHDTMLGEDQPDPEGLQVEAVTFMLRDKSGGEREVTRRFVQAGPDDAHEGVLPRTLKTLLNSRAAVRRQMKSATDEFAKSVMDGMQLAYKVTANSLYGQLGSATSDICCVDIAASTTAVGRSMLLKLRDFVETVRDGDVVYGDSVAGHTPVHVRAGGCTQLMAIEDVGRVVGRDAWLPCLDAGRGGKEYVEFRDVVEVWSDGGWTRARRLVRHRLAPHKRVLRVTTRTGLVDVTDDHSLLRPDASVVKPDDLVAGDALLHADLPAEGVFANMAEADRRDFWTALFDDGGVCRRTSHVSAAHVFALGASLGRGLSVSTSGEEIVLSCDAAPPCDAMRDLAEVADFPEGGYVYDFTTDNHHFAAGVGRIVVHNTDSCFMSFPRACRGLAGKAALRATIKAAEDCSAEFRKIIKKPQNAEYEKTFWPFILISKKRYVGNMYEDDPDAAPKQKSMGLVLKRRDNAPIVKTVYGGVIDRLLNGANVGEAAQFVRDCMNDLISGRVPVADLVVSKNLGGEYADPDRIAHAVLARRMEERDPGSAPAVGDRVPYVYVLNGKKGPGTLQGDRIEHPDHLGDTPVDYEHYITNQVMNPVAQLFALMVLSIPGCRLTEQELARKAVVHLNECGKDEEKARKKDDLVRQAEVVRLIFEPCLRECERKKMGAKDVTTYF
jgi:DNA polymerase elongation subunit (family B)